MRQGLIESPRNGVAALVKVVSGGQTGADRGALKAALDEGVACGGWCPAGRLAEDGTVPEVFPVTELPGASYADRTQRNVIDSDGTVLFYCGRLIGGSLLTRRFSTSLAKPLLTVDAVQCTVADAARAVTRFVAEHHIGVLNVAGSRASEWPEGEPWVRDVMGRALTSQ